jgi:hypothetical protein
MNQRDIFDLQQIQNLPMLNSILGFAFVMARVFQRI